MGWISITFLIIVISFTVLYREYIESIKEEYYGFNEKRYYTTHNIGLNQTGSVSYGLRNNFSELNKFTDNDHFILSIDGGGIFGVVPLLQLKKLAKCLELNNGTRDIHKYFDIIAGNSTGSIIAAGLVTPTENDHSKGNDVDDLYEMYTNRGEEIFPNSNTSILSFIKNKSIYENAGRKKVFDDVLRNKFSSDALSDFVIPFFDTFLGPVYFTRDHGAHQKNIDGSISKNAQYSRAKMSDLVMYSSSAPIYFNPFKGTRTDGISVDGHKTKYGPYTAYDGALYQNDPSLLAITEARRDFPGGRFHLISLGTGISYRGSMLGPLDIHHPDIQKSNANLFLELLPSFMEGSVSSIDEFLRSDPSLDYVRIDVPLKNGLDLSMDNASKDHIDEIKKSVDASSSMNDPIILNVCRKLSDFRPNLREQ